MGFFETLQEQASARKSRRGRLLVARLRLMTPARRRRVLARLEAQATTYLVGEGVKAAVGAGAVGIDWGSIDWDKFFENLMKILLALLPLFL